MGRRKNYFRLAITLFLFTAILISQGYADENSKIFKLNEPLENIRSKIEQNEFNFTVDHNWVYDMTPEEKEKFFSRKKGTKYFLPARKKLKSLSSETLPESFDWRNVNGKSYIGDVRNQSDCGSCYAFGAASAAEGVYNYANGLTDENCADFSEAYIMWCLGSYGDYGDHFSGCDGADYEYAELEALTKNGILLESEFPYQIYDPGSCPYSAAPDITLDSWGRTDCNDIDAMKSAIMTYGVMDAAVYVTDAFTAYAGGVFEDDNNSCPECEYTNSNHAIALVGWNDNGDAENSGYWILRNSWGSSWGENGYMRIKYRSAAVSCSGTYLVYEGDPINVPDLDFPDDYLVLQDNNPILIILEGRAAVVYGSQGTNNVGVSSGSHCRMVGFSGTNSVYIEGLSDNFTVKRNGAMVILRSASDSILINIPATKALQQIIFSDGSSELTIRNGVVVLGNQIVESSEASVDTPADQLVTSIACFSSD